MNCSNCGIENDEQAKFCKDCGHQIVETQPTAQVYGNNITVQWDMLVHPKERLYFKLLIVATVLIFISLIVSVAGIGYIIALYAMLLVSQGIFIGSIRGNGVRITERQFPEVFNVIKQYSERMGIYPVPEVYIIQQGGLLNAFATRFFGRDFMVIFSDIFELAYEKGESALSFVIGHELGHIKRRHVTWFWLLYPALLIPFLGTAYSRACEYTCDRIGAYFNPGEAASGLLVLAAGKRLYKKVDVNEFIAQVNNGAGFWTWLSEILSTHPNLPKRIKAITKI